MRYRTLAPARVRGPAVFLAAAGLAVAFTIVRPAAAAAADDHQQAVAALSDLTSAIAELVQADASYATDRTVYRRASQRAINAIVGRHGDGYAVAAGSAGDADGAIGNVDALLDRRETPLWAAPLHGVEANMRAAVVHLKDSLNARELMDYELAASRALTYLEVARGRPTETGVLGGLEGVLANTVLGVPAGSVQEDGCAAPSAAPAYGTHDGAVAWVSLPSGDRAHALAENPGGTDIVVQNGMIVLNTAAAKQVAAACASHAAAASAPVPAVAQLVLPSPPPALYTTAQAVAGAQIFSTRCVSCHGANLQGTAAPAVAGTDFLEAAQRNGWTLAVVRYLVVHNMPLNSAASLSPTEYANTMAFLLASNCYPAGAVPFPVDASPEFANIRLGPVPGPHPGVNGKGVCKVG